MTKFSHEVRTMNEASWVVPWLTQTNPRWRRPPSLILEKNINNSGLDKDICTNFHGNTQQGHAEMITWPKVGKMSTTLNWMKIYRIKLYGKMHHGDAEMITWPKVETGSWFAWRHQMKVWSIRASMSVTITDIWTKFGTEHKYHTTNTDRPSFDDVTRINFHLYLANWKTDGDAWNTIP